MGEACVEIGKLVQVTGGQLDGEAGFVVRGIAGLEEAKPGDLSFAADERAYKAVAKSAAGALIVPKNAPGDLTGGRPAIRCENPRLGFARALEYFAGRDEFYGRICAPGISPDTVIERGAGLGSDLTIGAGSYICGETVIGDNVVIGPSVYVGAGSSVGDNSIIYPNVVIREKVKIGRNCIIHSGTVIGSDGFGFVTAGGEHHKVPHIGVVLIEDDVELGANVTVDRGTCGATVIGRGTKIDNLVQIAHNVKIGRNCLIAALSGLAGSSELGDNVTLAGQTGLTGHLKVGNGCTVMGRAVVTSNLPPGSVVSGFPARPHSEEMRVLAASRQVPDLMKTVRKLEKKVKELDAVIRGELPEDGIARDFQ